MPVETPKDKTEPLKKAAKVFPNIPERNNKRVILKGDKKTSK